MRAVIAGGSGFIGSRLSNLLVRKGFSVTILSRSARASDVSGVSFAAWDGVSPGGWEEHLEGADAVFNLAGANIAGGRWTAGRKKLLLESRLNSCAALAAGVAKAQRKPAVVVQVSAIGIYGPRRDEPLTEKDAPPPLGAATDAPALGGALKPSFLSRVTQQWEAAARAIEAQGVRTPLARMGVVLGPGGGALQQFLTPFKMFVGGPLGSGRQWLSWVHAEDAARALLFLAQEEAAQGAYNVTAPAPKAMKDFCAALGAALGRPSWLPAPAPALKLALGQMAEELILSGQRVLPHRLQQAGFSFQYPELDSALSEILGPI